jgi:hypothetical protein
VFKILLIASFVIPVFAIEYPSAPVEPTVASPQVEGADKIPGRKKNKPDAVKVTLAKMKLRIQMGDKSTLLAEVEIPESYSFTHKKGNVQYNQTISAEQIREIQIENYRGRKTAAAKEGDVFEFEPYQVRIELKDGQVYKLQYLFKDLRKIKAKNADGNFAVFAFFADTYKIKSGWLERPDEDFKLLTRRAHPGVYTKLEYFEPVEKAGAAEK